MNLKKQTKLAVFNESPPSNMPQRYIRMAKLFSRITLAYIEPPFYCLNGTNIKIGAMSYLNFNCRFSDDGKINVGKSVMFGPNVTILSEKNSTGVNIGDNSWIGAGVVIHSGITIGENTVIGAGSIVTENIPPNAIAVGNPCKVIRKVDDRDKKYYFKERQIPQYLLNKKSKSERNTKMSMKDKMHTGDLYLPGDSEIMKDQLKRLDRLYDFNRTRPTELNKREKLLKEMFAEIGESCYIEPPFYSNFGGGHIHFGNHIYCNFGVTMVDDTHIYVGDNTLFGPNVTIATAGHPILPELRKEGYQYNMPVHIGKNCWIGAGAVIVPGVTIGDNVVIGAGSIVTKNIPSNTIAVGNPCKVLREVNEHDKKYYFKDRKISELI